MIVLAASASSPISKHFFMLVVATYFLLCRCLLWPWGTLTRNAKARLRDLRSPISPLYIAWQLIVLKPLPLRWRIVLDPLLFNAGPGRAFDRSACLPRSVCG